MTDGRAVVAHGLAQDEVAPDWPPLSVTELRPVLAGYEGVGDAAAVLWRSARPFAASGIVRGARGTVFVKRHDPRVRSVADLAEEHAFMAHLRRRGVPVPLVLAAEPGHATSVAGSVGIYEVHALAEGRDAYRDAHSWTPLRGIVHAEALGRALARLHLAAEGFGAPPRRSFLVVAGDALLRAPDLLAGVEVMLGKHVLLRRALEGRLWRRDLGEALGAWHAALQPCVMGMKPLWVHGDFHASNLFWRDDDVSAVLDFGLCNRASAAYDLATAIERNAIAWLEPAGSRARPELAQAMLRGYDTVRPRPADERAALMHVLPIVHVDFALSELAYFHGVTRSAANAEAAYTDFLLGHARWFTSAEAVNLLQDL